MRPWLASIAYSELQARYAFYLDEPWGYEVDNYRMGTLASVAANLAGNKTKPADFYPKSFSNNQTENSVSEHTDPQGLLTMFQSLKSSQES